jgi:calcineurin-like phosphoesterase
MRILFLGDIVGRPGRAAIHGYLPQLRRDLELDLVVANERTLRAGLGLTAKDARQLLAAQLMS